ncbi:uncharacterized protein KY384_001816 [Bacidia gigantensis]|uniref:uncharacterized protein n=1 Tax=Bacidia gigantensis TaxID=2732470 RepID=UPI001D03F11F|nr:uncharacterized protein KY384_001816 [Bacidia gigantensis]KAG8533033.1 hypothetical protein KY384_001816 [Bacidia gigantensis]
MAYYPQPCDTFFVESHDDRGRRYRDEMREQERQAKRQIQLTIAEQLSEIASHEYRYDHLIQMEKLEWETLPDVASIDIQTEIQWYMRPYLLDFLVEAHAAFGLIPETFFLAINLLDRYCSRRIVYKKHYQLVGCAALLIASKYGDRKDRVPQIKELKSMCCGLYEDDMFVQMEWHVLQTLNWAIGHPTIDGFIQTAVEHLQYDPEVEHMACYIAEIAMYQRDFIGKRPSDMARASLALSRSILSRPQEHATEWAGQYEPQTLMLLSQQLHRPSKILSRKYATVHFSRVALILDDFLARQIEMQKFINPPPTPPAEARKDEFSEPACKDAPQTPSKIKKIPMYNNGCPTPPDTPTNQEYFSNKLAAVEPARPPTPASIECYHYRSNVTLPPISSLPTEVF